MTEEEFWEIVDLALIDSSSPFFLEDHYLSYWNVLATLSDEQLAEFAVVHSQIKQQALAGNLLQGSALQMSSILGQGWTDKDFQNVFIGLISRGRKVFSDFLLDPEATLLTIDRPLLLTKCEAFDYAPLAIQGMRTGKIA
jgi:hypothetical protein